MKKEKLFVILFFIAVFLWCWAISYPLLPDYDIWARLIAGKSVLENGVVLKHDFMSYTPTHVWYDHEWLSGTVFYFLTTIAGKFHKTIIEMLGIFKVIMSFATVALIAACVYVRKPKNSSAFQILYFAVVALAMNVVFASTVRCHMFTFLLFAFWLLILEIYRITDKKILLAFLPLTMVLWGNLHGGCLSGLGLLIIYAIGEALNKKDIRPYLATLFVSFMTLFINPYGAGYVKFLFTAGTMDRNIITEWASPFSMVRKTYKFIAYFFFMLFIFLIQPLAQKEKQSRDNTKLLLLVVTAVIAVLHVKLLPFFVISSAVFMFDDVYNIVKQVPFLRWSLNAQNLLVYAVILFFSVSSIDVNMKNRYGVINYSMYPYKAVSFLKQNAIVGHLFTEFTYGSYCIYKLYPQNKIFMDGRYEEVYNPNLLKVMKNFIRQEGENPNSVLTDYNTDIVLLFNPSTDYNKLPEKQRKVFKALEDLKWNRVYKDEFFEIYLAPNYPKKRFLNGGFEPLKHSLMMFETGISKEILNKAAKGNKIAPFSK